MSLPIGITFRKPTANATITEVVHEKYGAASGPTVAAVSHADPLRDRRVAFRQVVRHVVL